MQWLKNVYKQTTMAQKEELLPFVILSDSGRIVNVSETIGKLQVYEFITKICQWNLIISPYSCREK